MYVIIALVVDRNKVIGPFDTEEQALTWKREHKVHAFVRKLETP